MTQLNVDTVNIFSPYSIWVRGDEYVFTTDNGIEYSVTFDEEDNFEYKAYWFNLTNLSHHKSPGDVKIAQTVICIIEEFFAKIRTFCCISVALTADSRLNVPDCF